MPWCQELELIIKTALFTPYIHAFISTHVDRCGVHLYPKPSGTKRLFDFIRTQVNTCQSLKKQNKTNEQKAKQNKIKQTNKQKQKKHHHDPS